MYIQVQLDYSPLLEKMKEKDITGYQLANYGIPRKTLYNIRTGKIITLEILAKLAYVLDCEINELVKFEYTIIDE